MCIVHLIFTTLSWLVGWWAGGPDPAADLPALPSWFLQITQTEVQQGQQQFSQFTDGQVGHPA